MPSGDAEMSLAAKMLQLNKAFDLDKAGLA